MRHEVRIRSGLTACVAMVLLAACHRGTPSGQVAATVGDDEITVAELRLETGDAAAPEAQQAALQGLIGRKLLFREAERQQLDKTPAAIAARTGAEETALAQLLESSIAQAVQVDQSSAAIDRFIQAHPVQFSDRQLISVDQLLVSTTDAGLAAQIGAAKTLPAVAALLAGRNVAFVRSAGVLDTATMPSEIATKLAALGADQPFIAPGRSGLQVSWVTSRRTEPLSGEGARVVARQLIDQQRAQGAKDGLRKVIDDGRRRVWIDPAFMAS